MDTSLKTKKRLTTFAQAIFVLFNGIEFAVILPTLNEYIAHLGGDVAFFGMVMSAFSLTGVLASPIFGLLQDRFHNTKTLVLFSIAWAIAGNFLYFYGGSIYVLLGSRLVAGVSTGVISAIYAHIAKTTSEAERSGAIAFFLAARQLGLMFGPAFNLPITTFDFNIGSFPVNSLTAPGFVMCVMFILLAIIVLVCYYDIPPLNKTEDEKADSTERVRRASEQETERQSFSVVESTCSEYFDECDSLETGRKRRKRYGKRNAYSTATIAAEDGGARFSRTDVVLFPEVIVLLTAQFVLSFTQAFQETVLTVMTKRLLNFGALPNSIIYALIGVELLIVMISVNCVSKFISDRALLFGSLTSQMPPFIFLLVVYPSAPLGQVHQNLWWLATIIGTQIPGLGVAYISMISLYSKVTPIAMQGYAHGVRRAVTGIATIMGPLWAGCIENLPYVTLGTVLGAYVFTWVMTLLSWSRLKPKSTTKLPKAASPCDDGTDETQTLLQKQTLATSEICEL